MEYMEEPNAISPHSQDSSSAESGSEELPVCEAERQSSDDSENMTSSHIMEESEIQYVMPANIDAPIDSRPYVMPAYVMQSLPPAMTVCDSPQHGTFSATSGFNQSLDLSAFDSDYIVNCPKVETMDF